LRLIFFSIRVDGCLDRADERIRGTHPADDSALGFEHVEGRFVELRKVGAGAIGQDEALETSVVCLARGRLHADFCGDPGQDKVRHTGCAQNRFEIRCVERPLAWLVQHHFALDGRQFWNDVVAGRTAGEQAAHRAIVADAKRRIASVALGREEIGEVFPVTLAGVDHRPPVGPERLQHPPGRFDRAAQGGDIIAEGLTETARFDKIPLEVDAHQRDVRRIEFERIGFGR
jgi:hypothetical protein